MMLSFAGTQAKNQFLESELAELVTPGSWEENLVSQFVRRRVFLYIASVNT